MTTISPIPQPPTIPFLGNTILIDSHLPLHSFELLAQQYGEIYKLLLAGGRIAVCINSQALVQQVSDDKRFKKTISANLMQVRSLVGDGLFTAFGEEKNWGIAHRLLIPAFSTFNVRSMFDGMKDICEQLLLKWERFGPTKLIDPAADYTRLTFDTIALCSMSFRLNSFYGSELPKFVQDLGHFLTESNSRAFRPGILQSLPSLPYINKSANDKYAEDIKYMTEAARRIVQERRENPQLEGTKDLLSLMLDARDTVTDEKLSEEAIIYNLLTFLIAGHETTSGLLTFATYHLVKNPESLRKLREELDTVIGDEEDITLEQLGQCEYLIAVMRETLRLTPPAVMRGVEPKEDHTILIGGDGDPGNPANKRYEIRKGMNILVQEYIQMKDHRVWGEDAELFRPERMMGGAWEKLPPGAWQPFGFGARACIGRPFAWQEAQLVLASVFRRFDITFADPSYSLVIKQAMAIKPKDLLLRVSLRPTVEKAMLGVFSRRKHSKIVPEADLGIKKESGDDDGAQRQKMYVLYGSNTGTCEAFAQRVASDARAHGFQANLSTLDSKTGQLPTDGPFVIITASFEGEPADNAVHFVNWLEASASPNPESKSAPLGLDGVKYAIFGCGNREWVNTYQRIPIVIDDNLQRCGAKRLLPRGEGDAGLADFFSAFDKFEENMWSEFSKVYGTAVSQSDEESSFNIEVIDVGTARARLLRQDDAAMAQVVANKLLTKGGTPEKRHIKLKLPEGVTYRAGDYLAIIPLNPHEVVQRALAHFGLSPEEKLSLKVDGPTTLPTDEPVAVNQLLSGFVELSQPATVRDLELLETKAKGETTKTALATLREKHRETVLEKRITVLEILEDHHDIELPFSAFLRMLPPMRVRQYSISSSPLSEPGHLSLTVSILEAPTLSGHASSDGSVAKFYGVASTFLARLSPGECLPVLVRPSNAAFHLPNDPTVPAVMFCAGSGIAPFRGFLEERAAQKASGREVGRMLLFFGCRAPDVDFLYADGELGEWVKDGIVEVRPAFSRSEDRAAVGCKYVQDRVLESHAEISEQYRAGAKFYTCGSRKVATGVKQAILGIIKQNHPDFSDEQVLVLFEGVQKERFASDVFD